MCYNCGVPAYVPCKCYTKYSSPCCPPTSTNGCPIQLDFTCVIYHKNNNVLSNLSSIGLNNGATLELFAETVAGLVGPLNVEDWSLPYLREAPNSYTINNIEQFGEAVDTEFADIQDQIDTLSAAAAVSLTANDSTTINFSTSGTLDHTLTGSVIFSATVGNQASAAGDGLMVTPQTLSVSVIDKTLSISDGNTVSLAGLTCGVGGFLGNFVADPTAINGQYWFRTDLPAADGLRIYLDGNVRTIPTT
jgi:hypothetical protein